MASLKKCIELKCKQCTYDSSQPGSWRAQVEACTVRSCPLWEVRPITMETIQLRRGASKGNDIDTMLAGLPDEDEINA